MKEAKEQIKKILESAEEFMHYVPNCQKISMTVTPEFFDCLKVAYKALEDKEWIPVTKELPEEYSHILVSVKGEPDFVATDDYYSYGFDDWKDDVTAWMPAPEPYKGGDV